MNNSLIFLKVEMVKLKFIAAANVFQFSEPWR